MDEAPPTDAQFTSESELNEGTSAPYAGAFFPRSRDLTIAGGVFTSNVTNIHNSTPSLPSDFRRIPLGDLDLRKEICLDSGSNTVFHRSGRGSVRRVYSAAVQGCKSNMTVAVYQGEKAEEEWLQDISKYSAIRHPNIIQVFGTVSSPGLRAAIYHDELVLATQVLEQYRDSPLRAVFFCRYMWNEFKKVHEYLLAVFRRAPGSVCCTLWISPSTGRLCVDLTPCISYELNIIDVPHPPMSASRSEPPNDAEIIASLSVEEYHLICGRTLIEFREFSVSPHILVKLETVYRCPRGSELDVAAEITSLPEAESRTGRWFWRYWKKHAPDLEEMDDGWTRVKSCDVAVGGLECSRKSRDWASSVYWWLAQANHIFNCLSITSNYEDYILIHVVTYKLEVLGSKESIPSGYLFLSPPTDLLSGFHVPDCAAYWSLDPRGDQRLSTEEATNLGFPPIMFEKKVFGVCWNDSVYRGLRQFHQGKQFDPDSQNLARHLCYPLYRLADEIDPPFAHIDEDQPDERDDSGSVVPGDRKLSESTEIVNDVEHPAYFVLDAAEMPPPPLGWKLFMLVKFGLIAAMLCHVCMGQR
ncbi:hypothetical protein B0H14DRAFT_2901328 [Mycena olivaceomarginata]|nr:hypothetical protein B0H14DRAFT_2901328 [Mycena olivaceomarginata]